MLSIRFFALIAVAMVTMGAVTIWSIVLYWSGIYADTYDCPDQAIGLAVAIIIVIMAIVWALDCLFALLSPADQRKCQHWVDGSFGNQL